MERVTVSTADVLDAIQNTLPPNRDDPINLSFCLDEKLQLEISGTQRNCYLLLQKRNGATKRRVGACGIAYRQDVQRGEIAEYAHRFHCPQEIHESLRGLGLMTLMQSVRDAISGRLDHETSKRSDLMTLYIRRGYLPTGYFDTSASTSWKSEKNMHAMNHGTYLNIAEFLRRNYKKPQAKYCRKLIRFGYSPRETGDLYEYITGGKNKLQDAYLEELHSQEG